MQKVQITGNEKNDKNGGKLTAREKRLIASRDSGKIRSKKGCQKARGGKRNKKSRAAKRFGEKSEHQTRLKNAQ